MQRTVASIHSREEVGSKRASTLRIHQIQSDAQTQGAERAARDGARRQRTLASTGRVGTKDRVGAVKPTSQKTDFLRRTRIEKTGALGEQSLLLVSNSSIAEPISGQVEL